MTKRKWFCMRCFVEHDIVDGAVQCSAPKPAPLTPDQIKAALDWAVTHDIIKET
jgi:hypothetical protein